MKKQGTSPPNLAVALEFDGENAPRVSAKGTGELAQQIVQLAEANGIPLDNDPELSALLAQLPLGDEIPDALYRAVAEVIAFAWMVSGKRPIGFVAPEEGSDIF